MNIMKLQPFYPNIAALGMRAEVVKPVYYFSTESKLEPRQIPYPINNQIGEAQ